MSFTNQVKKLLKNQQLCMGLAILAVLAVVLFLYNRQKGLSFATMQNSQPPQDVGESALNLKVPLKFHHLCQQD